MAHESFEDTTTAAVMNQLYINIKVDREERPDLDKIYQTAHQVIAQRPGGWPLTVFLTPEDLLPFFAGTYFPPEARHGLPSFVDLMQAIHRAYQDQRQEINEQNQHLLGILQRLDHFAPETAPLNNQPVQQAIKDLKANFDATHGGFGGAPKFPHATGLNLLLRHAYRCRQQGAPDDQSQNIAILTLKKMSDGGMFDQLGGGFFRYSIDERWHIPHFEKMLYDNGPLLGLYSEACALTADPRLYQVANMTAHWVMQEMQDPDGGYYATLDADSEGEEGVYYLWTPQEIRSLLDEPTYAAFADIHGLQRPANFEGHWHLLRIIEPAHAAARAGLSTQQIETRLDQARQNLVAARNTRIRPNRDEKILTAWNGLMISGMATAARHLSRPELAESATRAADFIRTRLWDGQRLLATHKDGQSRLNAYLDDYAYLLDGLLSLLELRWRRIDFDWAIQLADSLLEKFEDSERGGFYFTSHDHEVLPHRSRPFGDDSTPAGNAIAAHALLRLGHLLGEARYLTAAEKTLRAAWSSLSRSPQAHSAMMVTLQDWLMPPTLVVIRGSFPQIQDMQAAALAGYHPNRMVIGIPSTEPNLPGILHHAVNTGQASAQVCIGHTCLPLATRVDELLEILKQTALA